MSQVDEKNKQTRFLSLHGIRTCHRPCLCQRKTYIPKSDSPSDKKHMRAGTIKPRQWS